MALSKRIGTKKNSIRFDMGEHGVRMFLFDGNECIGWTAFAPVKSVRIWREGRKLHINAGGSVIWVSARYYRY